MPKTAQKPVFTKHEMAPIRVEIPGFALGALTDKAQEWADHFNEKASKDPRAAEVASAWYAVTAALANALSTYNVTLPIPGEKKAACNPEALQPISDKVRAILLTAVNVTGKYDYAENEYLMEHLTVGESIDLRAFLDDYIVPQKMAFGRGNLALRWMDWRKDVAAGIKSWR